jgi:type I restriction enzyme S subunit
MTPDYPVLVSGTIWGGLVRKGVVDPHYLVASLSCPYAVMARTRLRTNLNVEFLSAEDLLSLALPTPATLAQRYIGDKVRQAERLRERARRLEAEFRSAVTIAIPSPSSTAGKTSRAKAGELGRNLNPGAYTPDRRAVRAAIQGGGGRALDMLADVETPTTDSYLATAPYVGLDAIDSATCGLKSSTARAEAVAGTARLLRQGPALSRLRPYLNKVTYIPLSFAGGIGSTELLLILPKAGIDGWFLYGVLKLESTVRQLNPVATGSTHPRIDREDVLDLLVPWHDRHEALGRKLQTAQACYFASATLTATATTLVEHLIDGRITEADLVAAQKALDGSDRNADREILKALQRSDAPDAKPLIADVDALYTLLDEPEAQDA